MEIFKAGGCIPLQEIKGAEIIVLKVGNEYCDGDGACGLEKICNINDEKYIYERRASDENGALAMFRISR
ncbi:hypothetical protein E0H36_25845 [Rhizobium leguminosarum bv. viciae]|uniref:Uncharacterized protein n=1 Tax=Rhizobium leguminosarum TaxID=384 RepID=A0A6P0AYA2_RHILE|nr:hypothetical protein [Rhizobium leguminosarum]MBY5487118.1 hypothetical protein [Rhizobium leguminosarum]NEI32539.1 hypothetical protein [Rhizobium leguminosarum]NEI39298.1 hypothetical protein [Rhizobium leguminosarum]TBZ28685.1 hypothetical protein E0H36_25845 [Rhizobium leguminosarum bv. viciae]